MGLQSLRRIGKIGMAAFALIAAGSLWIGSTSAEAAETCQSGTCGPHAGAVVKCNAVGNTNPANTMSVQAPDISAVSVYRPGYAGGPTNVQWVAYRATLLRYDGISFVKTAYPEQPWVSFSAVSDSAGFIGYDIPYWEWHQNQWTRSTTGGRTFFTNLPAGAYQVSIEYYWFADPEDGLRDGYDVLPSQSNDYPTVTSPYGEARPGYCAYSTDPGNATWIFGG